MEIDYCSRTDSGRGGCGLDVLGSQINLTIKYRNNTVIIVHDYWTLLGPTGGKIMNPTNVKSLLMNMNYEAFISVTKPSEQLE